MDAGRTGAEARHVVIVCGGAVAGSEAAALAAERGALVVVVEQNDTPYGKIEDGLPRWHERLRRQEYERIDANLNRPSVLFVPRTGLGRDIAFGALVDELAPTAVLLAIGAWRDRSLPVPGIDRFEGRGLVYQNDLVYWFNHCLEPGYRGPRYDPVDGAIVVGGGLASIDVAKILQFEVYGRALRARGAEVTLEELETRGIPEIAAKAGIALETLGLRGCTLYYRRRLRDMPLVSADESTPEQRARLEVARAKVMDRVMRKYLVRVQECAVPVAPIVDGDRLAGLSFRRTTISGTRLVEVPDSDFEVRSDLVVSSIGSVPLAIEGIPTRGELFEWKDTSTGELMPRVYGLGNVLTGRGNIKESRTNAREIMDALLLRFAGEGGSPDAMAATLAHRAREAAAPVVERALAHPRLPAPAIARIVDWVHARWNAVGYDGNYRTWIESRGI